MARLSRPATVRKFGLEKSGAHPYLPEHDASAQPPSNHVKSAVRGPRTKLITDPVRSALMGRVRQKGTSPELSVREILSRLGVQYSTNVGGLPGSPDIVDVPGKRAIYIHGCYWHRHARCTACTTPKRNAGFWAEKFERNVERDARKVRQLRRLGYRVITVWECQLKQPDKLARLEKRLERFFEVKK
jgi:DNA mismatch endonuclease (patch repair protein)